jgi:hypothetical protein
MLQAVENVNCGVIMQEEDRYQISRSGKVDAERKELFLDDGDDTDISESLQSSTSIRGFRGGVNGVSTTPNILGRPPSKNSAEAT